MTSTPAADGTTAAAPAGALDSDLVLPAATTMDAVTLHVADLDGTAGYYREALGLEDLPLDATRPSAPGDAARAGGAAAPVVLGRGGTPLVVLVHTPHLPPARPGQAGLFHTALLWPDRASLAATVARAAAHPRSRYVGAQDHLVSQAFYFADPEGNGIELYWDRPRESWRWHGDRVAMDSIPLDPNAFLREHLAGQEAASADVGHVHLKVGDIARARSFYVDALGFEVTADLGTALFVSAGGYHHHVAMNTWTSLGAGPRAATIGLGRVSIAVPGRDDLDALAARLSRAGATFRDDGRTLRFEDPWRSVVEVSADA
ncbi:VOC family protein [Quadrisphaera sp. DSM 44207]|uniref:VOC family protein n=1 Tax=Quadrisphaera sp. DSM 44207 TaxID=1881057 RepID=UPI00088EE19C|nr:VOC family protein [Quadrisphaera sp. DSM 44207]SDQ63525.1 catechol 2,3-dioxygenase [Quadrisphaera sp. DSM 44207]